MGVVLVKDEFFKKLEPTYVLRKCFLISHVGIVKYHYILWLRFRVKCLLLK